MSDSKAETERDRALEKALADWALGPIRPVSRAVQAWPEELNLHPLDAKAWLAQDEARVELYRALPRAALEGALKKAIPRSLSRLGGERFAFYWARFLQVHGPRSHYLRDITGEFLGFCRALWERDPQVPDYLPDLARYEALAVSVAAQHARPAVPTGAAGAAGAAAEPLSLARGLGFIDSAEVHTFEFRVHELSEDASDRSSPNKAHTVLLIYRDDDFDVRYLLLSHLAGEIVRRLLRGEALGAAVTGGCAALGEPVTNAAVDGVATLVSDLATRGVILGPR